MDCVGECSWHGPAHFIDWEAKSHSEVMESHIGTKDQDSRPQVSHSGPEEPREVPQFLEGRASRNRHWVEISVNE